MAATPDQIGGWYQQYLGRAASPAEITNWTNGTYGPDPQSQIPASGEAQAYRATRGPVSTAPTAGTARLPPSSGTLPTTPDPSAPAPASDGAAARQAMLTGLTDGSPSPSSPAPGQSPVAPGTPPIPLTAGDPLTGLHPAPGTYTPPGTQTPLGGSSTLSIGADALNGFGGITYAGFSPQNHQGADLRDPMNAKYALQQYLVQNGGLTGGTNGNAAQIAATLNRLYGAAYGNPNFFTASDAETIQMPDGTYVHAAPNGYGMARGTFNPNNTGEVFWGASGSPSGGPGGPGGGPSGGPGAGPAGATSGAPVAGPVPGGPSGPGGGGPVSAPFSPISISPQTSTYNQQMRDFLMQQLTGLSTPTTATDPSVAPALSAYDTQSQRDEQAGRDAIAERYYAMGGGEGTDSGGFNTSLQAEREAASGARANFAGSTIYQAAQAKRQQLTAMLGTATSAGLTDQAQQIQAQIVAIDAQLREQGLTQQNAQFGNSLGFNYAALAAQMNRDTLLAGLTGG